MITDLGGPARCTREIHIDLGTQRYYPEFPIWIFLLWIVRFLRPRHNEFATDDGQSEIRAASTPKSRETVPTQPVDATPSAVNLFTKGGLFDASEMGQIFLGTADRPPGPLEGETVVAWDWACLWQEPCVDSLLLSQHDEIVPVVRRRSPLTFKLAEREDIFVGGRVQRQR